MRGEKKGEADLVARKKGDSLQEGRSNQREISPGNFK